MQSVLFRPANEIQPEIALLFEFCIPLHSVHHAQQDLFATAAAVQRARTPPLPRPWVGTPPVVAPARRLPLQARGPSARGAPARGQARRRGPPAGGGVTGGPPTYEASWVCEIVPGLSVPSLRSLRPCPARSRVAAPSRSTVRRLNSVLRQHSRRSMPTISLQQRSTPVTDSVRKICQSYDIPSTFSAT